MRTIVFSAGLLLAALPLRADLPPTVAYTSPKLDVTFQNPEKFLDIRDAFQPTDSGQLAILHALDEALESAVNSALPKGYKLAMTFTNIKLAGDYEPQHGPTWEDVRLIRDVYIPMMKFAFTLTDPAGKVVKSGTVNLQDQDFMMRPPIPDDGPLHYEKSMLTDWVHGNIRP